MVEDVERITDPFARIALVAHMLTARVDPAELIQVVVSREMAQLKADGGVFALLGADGTLVPVAVVGSAQANVERAGTMGLERELPIVVAIDEAERMFLRALADVSALALAAYVARGVEPRRPEPSGRDRARLRSIVDVDVDVDGAGSRPDRRGVSDDDLVASVRSVIVSSRGWRRWFRRRGVCERVDRQYRGRQPRSSSRRRSSRERR
jgi:hypothetical protein